MNASCSPACQKAAEYLTFFFNLFNKIFCMSYMLDIFPECPAFILDKRQNLCYYLNR